jgi:hypothetical protein
MGGCVSPESAKEALSGFHCHDGRVKMTGPSRLALRAVFDRP